MFVGKFKNWKQPTCHMWNWAVFFWKWLAIYHYNLLARPIAPMPRGFAFTSTCIVTAALPPAQVGASEFLSKFIAAIFLALGDVLINRKGGNTAISFYASRKNMKREKEFRSWTSVLKASFLKKYPIDNLLLFSTDTCISPALELKAVSNNSIFMAYLSFFFLAW